MYFLIKVSIFLNIILFFSQLIITILSDSLVLFSDTLDSMIDILSMFIPFFSLYIQGKCDKNHNDCKLKDLSNNQFTILSLSLMIAMRFIIIINSITRFLHEPDLQQPTLLITIGIIGLVLNTLSACFIEEEIEKIGKEKVIKYIFYEDEETYNNLDKDDHIQEKTHEHHLIGGTLLHIISDALGSVLVTLIGLVLFFTNDKALSQYIDICVAIFISIIMLFFSIRLFIQNLKLKIKEH